MMTQQTLEQFIAQLHSLAFFEEFTFSANNFSPTPREELELADNLIWFGNFLAILQLKERNPNDEIDETSEQTWFTRKVIKKATKQVRDSLRYLDEHERIQITNERGHVFDIARAALDDVVKLVVYLPGKILPSECRQTKHHESRTAGFIHIIHANDYLEICRTLRIPADIVDYFRHRQMVIEKFGAEATSVPEALMMGHYLSGNVDSPPSMEFHPHLMALQQDEDAFDISGILRSIHDHIESSEDPYDYYRILQEFAKLSRSAWRLAKERFVLCVEKTAKGEFTLPYRFAVPETGCGFVFIPIDSENVAKPGWPERRLNGLRNFTYAHMYDQKLDKCVGVSISKEGDSFAIYWCLLEIPWERDEEMDRRLAENYPFRKVQEKAVHSFKFGDE
ncbi:MAG: hypothetical protein HN403_12755 [Rhodospirillales bacterium]|nr:hypothetical protein [Rhodospirillales bacterium]